MRSDATMREQAADLLADRGQGDIPAGREQVHEGQPAPEFRGDVVELHSRAPREAASVRVVEPDPDPLAG
ncbi:hypothetical protein ADK82_16030 [Streptomyces sp. NRRL S-4]|nr:hypothetical protein ADK82_16030 [Streptomyces sp. NRRL S-4]